MNADEKLIRLWMKKVNSKVMHEVFKHLADAPVLNEETHLDGQEN